MNCINDELIQKYIDNEVPAEENVLIRKHIAECKSCADRVEYQLIISKSMKSAINSIVDDSIEIPEFEPGKKITVKPSSIRKHALLMATLFVAACLVLFIIVFRNGKDILTEKQITPAIIYNYEIDANQPLSEQPLIIHVAGPDGNQIDYVIE